MHKRILGIIGAGHVGSHIAYAAGMLDAADIVKICDINEIAAASQVQDLNDAVKFMPGKVHYESGGLWNNHQYRRKDEHERRKPG